MYNVQILCGPKTRTKTHLSCNIHTSHGVFTVASSSQLAAPHLSSCSFRSSSSRCWPLFPARFMLARPLLARSFARAQPTPPCSRPWRSSMPFKRIRCRRRRSASSRSAAAARSRRAWSCAAALSAAPAASRSASSRSRALASPLGGQLRLRFCRDDSLLLLQRRGLRCSARRLCRAHSRYMTALRTTILAR